MRVHVLGPVTVSADDGTDTTPGSRAQRAILATLAANAGRVVSSSTLVQAVWGDEPPRTAGTTLRSHVSRLRAVTGDLVEILADGYRFAGGVDLLDADEFVAETRVAHELAPPVRCARLRDAMGLWRGEAFGDLADLEPVAPAARALEERRRSSLGALADAQLETGDLAEAVVTARRLLDEDDLREGSWCTLVTALAALERTADALRAAQEARNALAGAGLEPSHRLVAAEAAALDPPSAHPEGTTSPPGVPAEELTGRSDDADRVRRLLTTSPTVTLVGPGGVGKTALARRVADAARPRHRDGCVVVELARLSTAAVAAAVADSLGIIDAGPDPVASLARPAERDVLVVLDSCEHVLDAAARTIEALHRSGSSVRVLATSRTPVGVQDEQIHPVRPLPVEGPSSPATRLFRRRVAAVAPDIEISEADAAAIERIVTKLGGLPLALEMAAARVPTVGLTELADEIDRNPDLLETSRRTAEGRHRSLTSLIEWSEALLADDVRETLVEMSVFAGTVDVETVRAVLGDDGVRSARELATASLLEIARSDDGVQFAMNDTVRAHARRRLDSIDSADRTRRRHLEHHRALATTADAELRGRDEASGHRRITSAAAELRAAHSWALENAPAEAAALARDVLLFVQTRLGNEMLDWVLATGDDVEPGVVAAARALRAAHREDHATAEEAARVAAASADHRVACTGLETLSDLALFRGDVAACLTTVADLRALALAHDDPHFVAMATVNESLALGFGGETAEAGEVLSRFDDPRISPSDHGWLAYCRGEALSPDAPSDALAWFDWAAELADSVGNTYLAGIARVSATALRSRVEGARGSLGSYADVISRWRRQGAVTHLATTLRNVAPVLAELGAWRPAAEILGAVGPGTALPTWGDEERMLVRLRAELVTIASEADVAAAVESGRLGGVDGVTATVLATIGALEAAGSDPSGTSQNDPSRDSGTMTR